MRSQFWYVELPRDKIALFQWILGAYDGIAQFRTVDRFKAVVELMVPPGNEVDVKAVIKALSREWNCVLKLHYHSPKK
jgi:hypothetical protein